MVHEAKKTSVLVLIPGLFDRSRSRTVDTLIRMSWNVPCPINRTDYPIDSLHCIPGYEDEAELVVEEADEGVERHIDCVVSEGLQARFK